MADPVYVCTLSELQQNGGRKRLNINGRDIFVILHKDTIFGFDSFCYHAGGPLYQGDIEDTVEYTCLVCPWHKYKIALESGEGLYYSVDPHNLKQPPHLCSKGIKQRTHIVTRQEDRIYISLSYPVQPPGTTQTSRCSHLTMQAGDMHVKHLSSCNLYDTSNSN
ncbi:hypothetical protein Btru_040607 [Bulinus truncatus]|nr:hypothetical protein Btru_040607 [Bulinus truncatus]